jgi:hypothetical protein
MEERRISEDFILDCISCPELVFFEYCKCHVQKSFEGKLLEVVFVKTKRYIKIITVYWV